MLQTYTSADTQALLPTPQLDFVETEGCCVHPRRRRLRHVRSLHLRDLSVDLSSPKKFPVRGHGRRDTTTMFTGTEGMELIELYGERFYNVFYSLHHSDQDGDCFHVSEVAERTINADFQEIHFEKGPLSRTSSFVVKVWLSTFKSPDNFRLLISHTVKLSKLIYLNKELDRVPSLGINNSILITLFDGVYVLPTKEFNIDEYEAMIYDKLNLKDMSKSVPSLTYDLIMKLNNLNRNVDDLNSSKSKTSNLIDYVFQTECYDDSLSNHHFKLNRTNGMIQQAIAYIQLQKTQLEELRDLKQSKIKSIAKFKHQQSQKAERLIQLKQEFSDLLTLDEDTKNDLIIVKSEKVKQLVSIFPKTEIYEWLRISKSSISSSGFNFLEILPTELNLNSLTNLIDINDQDLISQNNAGLGYLAQIVFLLSRYLGIPLRYQIKPFGSTSYIIDKISQINQRNIFPLFYTNHFYRFQYAVILLNRNIQDILKEEDSLMNY